MPHSRDAGASASATAYGFAEKAVEEVETCERACRGLCEICE